jgi:hypothetical protein
VPMTAAAQPRLAGSVKRVDSPGTPRIVTACPGGADAIADCRRRRQLGRDQLPGGGEPVEVARRSAGRRITLPRVFKQSPITQAHEDRIEGAGAQTDLQAEFIAVAPLRRIVGQRTKHVARLR